MIYEASDFVFRVPSVVSRARRVLIKPSASYPLPYPVTTSADMLAAIISSIRRVSDADILLLEGTPGGVPTRPIYQALGYNFPRVLTLDVKDCIFVEVDNPLPKPFAMPTFWVPNVILSSDFLITVAPMKTYNGTGSFSIKNLLSLLPATKYHGDTPGGWESLYALGIDKVLADLYFTLPFDMGIVEAKQKFAVKADPGEGDVEEFDKVFLGEPYEADREAAEALGLKIGYLELIKSAKVELGA
ncbi:MAG: hypothetical protein A2Y92_00485 [Chloroflexi bacterium RBG_13_57_8]|nr:MAG: hypothetical protein A2Y92_00485 [Chloroflexi bacterium RBG_13_57_8]